jgi:hypothetical protein
MNYPPHDKAAYWIEIYGFSLSAFLFGTMMIAQVGAIFHLPLLQGFLPWATWISSLICIGLTTDMLLFVMICLENPLPRIARTVLCLMSAFSLCNLLSIHWHALRPFSLMANLVISTTFFSLTLWGTRNLWKPDPALSKVGKVISSCV